MIEEPRRRRQPGPSCIWATRRSLREVPLPELAPTRAYDAGYQRFVCDGFRLVRYLALFISGSPSESRSHMGLLVGRLPRSRSGGSSRRASDERIVWKLCPVSSLIISLLTERRMSLPLVILRPAFQHRSPPNLAAIEPKEIRASSQELCGGVSNSGSGVSIELPQPPYPSCYGASWKLQVEIR